MPLPLAALGAASEIAKPLLEVVKGSTQAIVSNVSAAGAAGEAFGEEIVGGLQSGFNSAFGAGAALSQTIIGGVLSPLGQTGQAITRATGAITNAVGSVFNTILSGAKELAGIGGKIAGIGAGVLLAGIGGAFGMILGPLGAVLGAAAGSAIAGFLGKALGAVGQVFGSIVSAAGEAIGKVGALFGELGSSLASILGDVAKTVSEVGGAVLKLESAGFSSEKAGKLVQTMGFFGQSPGKVAEQFGKPYAAQSMGVRAAALGLPNPAEDPEGFLLKGSQMAEKAKRGGARSAQLFQTRLQSTGFSDYASTFAMGPERVQKTLAVSRSFQASGAALGELGGDVQMANNILSGLGTQLKLVFAETLLPLLPLISSGFSFIVQNKDAIIGAIQSAGQWLVNELPPMILRGAAGILDAVSGLLGGFSAFTAGLAGNLDFILTAADSFLNGLRSFAAVLVGVATAVSQLASNFVSLLKPKSKDGAGKAAAAGSSADGEPGSAVPPGGMVKAGVGVPPLPGTPPAGTGASAGAGAAPASQALVPAGNVGPAGAPTPKNPKSAPQFAPVKRRSLVDAFKAGQTGFLDTIGPSNLAGNSKLKEGLSGFLKGTSEASANGSALSADWAKDLRQKADNWGQPSVMKALDKIATAVDKNGDKVANAVGSSASGDVFSSLERRLGRNAFLAATR